MLHCPQQVGGLQQKVGEMEMTQRDLVAEYEEHVMHLKEEVIYKHEPAVQALFRSRTVDKSVRCRHLGF